MSENDTFESVKIESVKIESVEVDAQALSTSWKVVKLFISFYTTLPQMHIWSLVKELFLENQIKQSLKYKYVLCTYIPIYGNLASSY